MDSIWLPQELTREIFTRVPVKSVIRFELLSKEWSAFIADHLRHSTKNNSSLLLQGVHLQLSGPSSLQLLRNELKSLHIHASNINNSDLSPKVVGYCNGLLSVIHACSDFEVRISVWNPAIRQLRNVCRPNYYLTNVIPYTGFGFNASVNDYKIVIMYVSHQISAHIEVYSLSTGSCNKSESSDLKGFSPRPLPVMANGSLFWLGVEAREFEDYEFVISFDLGHEIIGKIELPTSVSNPILTYKRLSIHEGSLAILIHSTDLMVHFNYLWVLENIGDSGVCWSKLYTVGALSGLIVRPVTAWRNDILFELIDFEIQEDGELSAGDSGIFLCNSKGKKRKILPVDGHRASFSYCVFNYTKRLVPVSSSQDDVVEEAYFTES